MCRLSPTCRSFAPAWRALWSLPFVQFTSTGTTVEVPGTRLWQLRAARAAGGAPAGGSTGVAGAHKFTEGDYFLFPFRRVSRLRRPFVLRPAASPCRTGRPAAICARRIAGARRNVAHPAAKCANAATAAQSLACTRQVGGCAWQTSWPARPSAKLRQPARARRGRCAASVLGRGAGGRPLLHRFRTEEWRLARTRFYPPGSPSPPAAAWVADVESGKTSQMLTCCVPSHKSRAPSDHRRSCRVPAHLAGLSR